MQNIFNTTAAFRNGLLAVAAASLTLVAWSCTELGDDDSPHPDDWKDQHPASLRASGYDFTSCQGCHGQDLSGTDEVEGCSNGDCHTATGGVYACDNCHGYLDSDPWENVAGDVSTDSVSVGMHTSHLASTHGLTNNVTCSACHALPDSSNIIGHINGAYAQVAWDSLAVPTHDGAIQPGAWDHSAATCSNIYCHGNFNFNGITGNDSTWSWVTPAAGDLCGTCHDLPPDGHSDVGADPKCGSCHANVVDSSENLIIDLDRHINGAKDF